MSIGRHDINPWWLTAALSKLLAARGQGWNIPRDCQLLPRPTQQTLQSQMQKASKAKSSCCSAVKPEATPLQSAAMLAGAGRQKVASVRRLLKTKVLQNDSLLFLLPHKLQETRRGFFYASDSSPSSCVVPSSADWSFRSMNFPSFVNGTDFISWANASGSWRKTNKQRVGRAAAIFQFPQYFSLRFCTFYFFFFTTFCLKVCTWIILA